MKKTYFFFFMFALSFALLSSLSFAQDAAAKDELKAPENVKIENQTSVNFPVEIVQLFDNGPFVTNPGQGCAGGDASMIDGTLTHTLFGWGVNAVAAGGGFFMADDFTVPSDAIWSLDSVRFYSYQTSATTLTLTGAFIRIWNGAPNAGGTVIWGDTTTNRMSSARLSTMYRVSTTTGMANCDRRIQLVVANVNAVLQPGTYWIEWGLTGTSASGPWQPPVTIPGQAVTGNALQRGPNGWVPALNGATHQNGAPFTLFGTSGVVPVELTSFAANVVNNNVTLEWSTATETNNQGFELQRKAGEGDFQVFGFVNGNGTTTTPQSYSVVDKNLEPGTYYYRLKQIDFDGQFEFSNVIEVEIAQPATYSMEQNYPNPFNPSTSIRFSLADQSMTMLRVYNVLGQEVATLLNGELAAGNHEVNFDASNFTSGVYVYQLEAVGSNGKVFVSTKKMILNK